MARGIVISTISMALWGLVFVLPLYVPLFSAFEVSMGRFVVYGLISLVYCLFKKKTRLPIEYWRHALAFALTSSLVYYFLLVLGVRYLGAAFGTALCSLLPIFSSIYGNYCHKVFSWKVLSIPLSLIFLGLGFLHFYHIDFTQNISVGVFLLGVLFIVSSQAMWSWYSVTNSHFLAERPHIAASDWSSFMGIICLFGGILGFAVLFTCFPETSYFIQASVSEKMTFVVVSLVNGFFASWLTLYLWNLASRTVPMALLGQMGACEVLFGLVYVYLKQKMIPSIYECIGLTLILFGLFISFKRCSQKTLDLTQDLI